MGQIKHAILTLPAGEWHFRSAVVVTDEAAEGVLR